eukprot:TRINITY_DN94311_c0_g1_i1.p1 TRINITY_DN94311_c0_g1~~TRINITY_DN94311_c0_g1_i1.p1  ORF type:complete len:333 (+),score=36.98 TRINITY_DN94311_c0_g1_i1:88-999(+)
MHNLSKVAAFEGTHTYPGCDPQPIRIVVKNKSQPAIALFYRMMNKTFVEEDVAVHLYGDQMHWSAGQSWEATLSAENITGSYRGGWMRGGKMVLNRVKQDETVEELLVEWVSQGPKDTQEQAEEDYERHMRSQATLIKGAPPRCVTQLQNKYNLRFLLVKNWLRSFHEEQQDTEPKPELSQLPKLALDVVSLICGFLPFGVTFEVWNTWGGRPFQGHGGGGGAEFSLGSSKVLVGGVVVEDAKWNNAELSWKANLNSTRSAKPRDADVTFYVVGERAQFKGSCCFLGEGAIGYYGKMAGEPWV